MFCPNKIRRITLPALLFLTLFFTSLAGAGTPLVATAAQARKLSLISGKSVTYRSALPITRVSIADPEIADVRVLSQHEIYVTGKAAGTTNMTLWQDGKISDVYDIEVAYDLSRLKRQIHEILPEEKELRIIGTRDAITLSGRISSMAGLNQALALARAYALVDETGEEKVNNLVEVGGIHQVMLEVRVAEMARSTTKRLGINFNYIADNGFGLSLLDGLSQLPSDESDAGAGLVVSPVVNSIFSFNSGSTTWTFLIDALKEEGLAKILAEPTLIALSGQTANFLAGGEFPIPVPQGLGSVAIEYKSFGVGLSFTPTVLSEDNISIQVTPDVSELDFTTAVQFSGFVIPGITTRRASTTIELRDGQSFAIAGLLRENIREAVSKFPLLGDVPVLGALFRSSSFEKNETELVIIVTPRLVKPLTTANQPLPTDHYIEPSDGEFYLEGLLQGREESRFHGVSGRLDGKFGHALPESD